MSLKVIRHQQQLSQELLAEKSGLSLRTIQRAESGFRVSYSSLRALAVALDTDVDDLERTLYSMESVVNEYSDYPLWVRFACGRGWFSASRQELHKIELFALFFSLFAGAVWFGHSISGIPSGQFPLFDLRMTDFFGLCSIGCLICAYRYSIAIRVGDHFDLWSRLEATQTRGFFGLKILNP